jgi:hypothetical protein
VGQGPDPARDGAVRRRGVDPRALVEERFGVVGPHGRAAGKPPRRLGFARLSARPKHPSSDPAAQAAFEQASPDWRGRPCPSARPASRPRSGPRTLGRGASKGWASSRARPPTRRRARRGSRPRAPRDRRYAWAHLLGAACPERAVGAGLVLPHAGKEEAMRPRLAGIGRRVAPGARAAVVPDGAGRHGPAGLDPPGSLTLLRLPP